MFFRRSCKKHRNVYNEIMSIKSFILFGLTLTDALMREFSDPGGYVSFSYKKMYGFVPEKYKRKSLYTTASNLKNEGNLDSNKRGFFSLTQSGKEFTFNKFPVLRYINKPWDGKWRIVGFDIEEENRNVRDLLRSWLVKYGFGMIQKSLYVSSRPFENDIGAFLSSNRSLFRNVYIFVSESFFVENRENFLDKIFSLEELNLKYSALLGKIRGGKENRDEIIREFLNISGKDPFLPKELLPEDFKRLEVWKTLKDKDIF